MEAKSILLVLVLCVASFLLGFAGNKIYKENNSEIGIASSADSVQIKNTDTTYNQQLLPTSNTTEENYSKILKGKFILKGAEYAGFDFIDSKNITWTNEMFPMDPDSMRLKWIDSSTFVTIFTESADTDCAPPNWVRKVEYYDGHKLILRNFWTGWKDLKDSSETFYKE